MNYAMSTNTQSTSHTTSEGNITELLEYTAAFATSLYRPATGEELLAIYNDLVALCAQDIRFHHLKYGDQVIHLLTSIRVPNGSEVDIAITLQTPTPVVILDPELSLMMLQLHGETYISAVAILSDISNIVVRTSTSPHTNFDHNSKSNEQKDLEEDATIACDSYFRLCFERGRRVAVAIRKQLVLSRRETKTITSENTNRAVNLVYSSILVDVGLEVAPNDKVTFCPPVATSKYVHHWDSNQYYMVDLRTWYCSCDDYGRLQRYPCCPHEVVDVSELRIDNFAVRRLVDAVTELRPAFLSAQQGLPVCSHLLALLLLVFNPLKRDSYRIYRAAETTEGSI